MCLVIVINVNVMEKSGTVGLPACSTLPPAVMGQLVPSLRRPVPTRELLNQRVKADSKFHKMTRNIDGHKK